MTRRNHDCIGPLVRAGIDYDDALALRRIAMTLHRWHELECGDGNDYASWSIVRGWRVARNQEKPDEPIFAHDDKGPPYIERHIHTQPRPRYERIADRERGALRRLGEILKRYPGLSAYQQGDPRGAALYILRPGDVPEGAQVESCYSNGIAVYK